MLNNDLKGIAIRGSFWAFAKAYFGLYPWDNFANSDYLDGYLISPDTKPKNLLFKKDWHTPAKVLSNEIGYFSPFVEDGGFDLLEEIREYIINKNINATLDMKLLISHLIQEDILPQLPVEDEEEIIKEDAALGLAELYLHFKATGSFANGDKEDELFAIKKLKNETLIINYIKHYLQMLWQDIETVNSQRAIVNLWYESGDFKGWRDHIKNLLNDVTCNAIMTT